MPDDTIEIPVEGTGESSMANDCTERFAEQAANTLLQIGNIAQSNLVTVNKVVDYDYLEGKHMVSLAEALGAREVASKESPGGPE
ncbi:MAG: hypothetical protein ACYSWU_23580 [Planctomycetota bacterium]|jgi:hypothetical protein